MLDLPEVTLACVDTRTPALALAALARCTAGIRFGDVVLLTDAARLPAPPPGVRVEDVRIADVPAYSAFMVKGLAAHVRTPWVLVVQWDGFVLHPDAWDPDFLAWDYVGPRWPGVPEARAVGNGGFSLRSRRLLEALQDPRVAAWHPEDRCICHGNRDLLEREHGIRFAPAALADRFGFERTAPVGRTFGFHGLFNFPRVLDAAGLRAALDALPPAMLRGRDGKDLCKALIGAGRLDEARLALDKRVAAGMRDGATRRLALRLAWARWARRLGVPGPAAAR